jgi:asparagine synthase (glutamine-hydrolysing)
MQQGVLAVSRRDGADVSVVRAALHAAGAHDIVLVEGDQLVLASWGGLRPDLPNLWLLSRGPRRHESAVRPVEVAALLDAGDAAGLAEVLPAFAAARRTGRDTAVAVTDALGFRHLYHSQGRGWSAFSTSARALALLGNHPIDLEALSLQSLLGWQVGQATPYAGVTKLAPGGLVRLRGGGLEIVDGRPGEPEALELDQAVERAADLLRHNLTAYVNDHPDASIQLTGGQDSRILLSAVPPELRRGLTAITLSVPGSEDVAIAADICARTGTRHHVEALASLDGLSPEEAYGECAEASVRLEGMADPLALAALTMAERGLDQGHRISGLGGEVARGFYYLGGPRPRPVTRARVARLASWRMFANEAVDPGALTPSLREHARDQAVDRIHGLMAATGKDWLAATDDFYLEQRMQRWAGVTDTAVCLDRSVVNPMLDDRFIAIAQGMSPESKRGSLFLARLQMALDPELGRLPLDGRPPPQAYASPGLRNRARAVQTVGSKAVAKARQRFGHSTRPPAGGTVLAAKVVEMWRREPGLLDPAREQGVLDDAWLDRVLTGVVDPAPSSVAFVLNVAALPGHRHATVAG